ncbi:MAG: phenylalanine--tRNA ligase subunit beta [Candidatus Sungbacteria bacterium]|nr:phenylalanine--tRNA ligase subunit beta [Candidatus Sungbacteria bacterium]
MKFSYNWLKSLYPKAPSPEKTAKLLTFHSFQVESLEKKGNDFALDIDILANRAADASAHFGVAREIAVNTGGTFKPYKVDLKEDTKLAKDVLSVNILAKNLVPRYAARVIDNINVGESPKWMQARLVSCGLRPINVIVDITNYVMLEIGQPLHAFDYDKLHDSGARKEIIVRTAQNSETIETLGDDSQKLKLTADDIVIADTKGAIALGGIKGGRGSEIHAGTKRVVLEAANFNPLAIRKTSRRLNLRTDASYRFEHNLDPELVTYALNRAALLLAELAGGQILKGIVDIYPKREPLKAVPFSIAKTEKLLGMPVPEAKAISILNGLDSEVRKLSKGSYRVMPPSYRRDLNIEEDLIEEVGRVMGYDKVKSTMPILHGIIPVKSDRLMFEEKIKDRLVGFGFTETHLSVFTGKQELSLFGLSVQIHYELENPVSPETAYLVEVPAIKFLRSASENLRNFNEVKIFGVARAFIKEKTGPRESRRLMVLQAERGGEGKKEFYELKGTIDALLDSFGISDHWYDDSVSAKHSWAHPGRVAEIKIGDKLIGVIAEISHASDEALKSKGRIVLAEFLVDQLLEEIESEQEFRPIAKFPAIVRDIALLVPQDIRIQEIEDLIESAASEILVDVDLFDVYEGTDLPEGMQSVALHLVFQSESRTLTDEEVNMEYQKIAGAVEEKGWEVRG